MSAQRRRPAALTAVVAVAATVAACSSGSGGGDTGTRSRPTVSIGVIAPESGSLSPTGKAVVAAVRMAVSEAAAQGRLTGWKVRVENEDDEGRPDVGAKVANTLAGDDSVIGVVGPVNSTVAATVVPVLAQEGIPVLSPSATDPALTGVGATGTRTRPYGTFFRLVPTDAAEGPAAAGYLVRTLGARRVVTVVEDRPYAARITASLNAGARRAGATSVTTVAMPAGSDIATVAAQVVIARPDAIVLATAAPVAARLLATLTADGVTAPVLGVDGTHDPAFSSEYASLVDAAAIPAEGAPSLPPPVTRVIDFGVPPDHDAAGRAFLARYRMFTGDTGPDPRPADELRDAAAAYDAASALLRTLPAAMAGRTAVDAGARGIAVTGVAATDVAGASGRVSFDRFGDLRGGAMTIYQVGALGFTAKQTITVP